jgi:hypothetical protein
MGEPDIRRYIAAAFDPKETLAKLKSRRRGFRVKVWGTSWPDDKLTGDLGNVIEAVESGDRQLIRVTAGKILPDNFRLLQHGVIPGSCHTKAQGISSPGTHEAIFMWPRKDGERQWNAT